MVVRPGWACFSRSMPTQVVHPERKRLVFFFFLTLNLFYLLTSSGRVRTIDEVTVDYQTESLAMRGSTAIPQALESKLFFGKLDLKGRPQAGYGVGQALFVVPWYEAARLLNAVLPGIPAGARNIFFDAVITASSATFAAIAATLLLLIFLRISLSNSVAVASVAMVALATPLFGYSAWFFSEPLASCLLLAAALLLFTGEKVPPTPGRALLAGLLLGATLWVRPTHLIAMPVFLMAIIAADRCTGWRTALLAALVIGVLGGGLLVRNQMLFGTPLDFGYPAAAEGGKQVLSFKTPLLQGLYGFLLSPGKSVFVFAPALLLAIAGIRKLARRNLGLAIVAGGCPVIYLLFFSKYTQWEGGYCVGPRYLLPAIFLLCLGLGPMMEESGALVRKFALGLFVAGFSVQLISMATSFLQDQAGGAYYDANWNHRMDYFPLVRQAQRFWHYATSTQPAPIGLGFDHWFVFLKKAGISDTLLIGALLLELLGFIYCAYQLKKSLRAANESVV
jgi:hypothetical protein